VLFIVVVILVACYYFRTDMANSYRWFMFAYLHDSFFVVNVL